jgi:8-amino-7-oxononanoate synthase
LTGGGFHGTKLRRFAGNFAMRDESFLDRKLAERRANAAFRKLRLPEGKVDLCSNDYLGVVRDGLLTEDVQEALAHGSGGSRLLAGNYPLIEEVEGQLAEFHAGPAALIYNSGYDANLGLLSCVPQRGDVVLYDALSHASIRDGMRLSFAQAYSFAHNDCADLERRLSARSGEGTCFVVTESVFSMDGDLAPLREMGALCRQYGAQLIVDEAHATGVIGDKGEGLVQALGLQQECFARVYTFGKAVGCHGAVVVGSALLRDYLINFSRSLIYTTALPPASVQAIARAYTLLPKLAGRRERLAKLIDRWRMEEMDYQRLDSRTPIQVVIVPGNEVVRAVAEQLQAAGLDVRPILYPTVPRGSERLRVVLHAFNTEEEIGRLAGLLKK